MQREGGWKKLYVLAKLIYIYIYDLLLRTYTPLTRLLFPLPSSFYYSGCDLTLRCIIHHSPALPTVGVVRFSHKKKLELEGIELGVHGHKLEINYQWSNPYQESRKRRLQV